MEISYFGLSDKGRVRKGNEDHFTNLKLSDNEYLFIVADGMGGHQAGDVASKVGTNTFVTEYKKLRKKGNPVQDSMKTAINKANNKILEMASSDLGKRGMGTTFSAMVIYQMKGYLAHVGDSRIYLVREDKIRKLTKDHTFVERMVEEGRITEEEARNHPQKNILYMSLGARSSFEPDIGPSFDVKEGDIFTMCSDGLNIMISDNVIKEYSQSYGPEDASRKLVDLANAEGGLDNVTVQIVWIGEMKDLSKTEPIKVVTNTRKRVAVAIFIFAFLVLVAVLLATLL